jgi:hypothetical protein
MLIRSTWKTSMAPQLRIFSGPDSGPAAAPLEAPAEQRVAVRLREILPVLADAVRTQRGWVHDFADEEIEISADLLEVITAYGRLHRPSA